MYSSGEILACIARAGLICENVSNPLGDYHTLFECRIDLDAA